MNHKFLSRLLQERNCMRNKYMNLHGMTSLLIFATKAFLQATKPSNGRKTGEVKIYVPEHIIFHLLTVACHLFIFVGWGKAGHKSHQIALPGVRPLVCAGASVFPPSSSSQFR